MTDSIPQIGYKQTLENIVSLKPSIQVQNDRLENVSIFRVLFDKAIAWVASVADRLAGRTESSLLGRVSFETPYDPIKILRTWNSFIDQNTHTLEKEDLGIVVKINKAFNDFVKKNKTKKADPSKETVKTEFSILAEDVSKNINEILIKALNKAPQVPTQYKITRSQTSPSLSQHKTITGSKNHIRSLSLIPKENLQFNRDLESISSVIGNAKKENQSPKELVRAANTISDFIENNTGILMSQPSTLQKLIAEIKSLKEATKQDQQFFAARTLLDHALDNSKALL